MIFKQIEKEFDKFKKCTCRNRYDRCDSCPSDESYKSIFKQSFIKYLLGEVERKKGMISYTRDMKSTWGNELIQEDIAHLQAQIKELEV